MIASPLILRTRGDARLNEPLQRRRAHVSLEFPSPFSGAFKGQLCHRRRQAAAASLNCCTLLQEYLAHKKSAPPRTLQ